MSTQQPFPSIEKILVAWLPTVIDDVEATAELPHDFQNEDGPTYMLPVNVVDRVSGAELLGSPILDRPIVDIDTYASSRDQAQTIAEQVRHGINVLLRGSKFQNVVFSRTRTVVAPRQLPHANPAVWRYNATYELVLHVQ